MDSLKRLWSMASTTLILATFLLIGYWGHRTHWTLGFSSHSGSTSHNDAVGSHSESSHENSSAANASPQPEGRLRLDGKDSAGDAGLTIESAVANRWRETVPALGTIAYSGQRIAQLSTRADGHVKSVFTRLGQQVKKGDILALIDSQVVGDAKSDWLQKAAMARFRKKTLEQMVQTGDNVLPLQRIRAAEAELREADLVSLMAQQRLMNLGFSVDFELQLDGPPEKLAEQVRSLGIPEVILDQTKGPSATANLIAILAPFDGIVVEQNAVPGEMVFSSNHQFVLADTSVMWVKLSVRREDASKLSIGQPVEFLADGIKQPIQTTLAWISAEIDLETRTVQASCEVPNIDLLSESTGKNDDSNDSHPSNRTLRANQFGLAKICVSDRPDAILVPESAIQKMPNQQSIIFVSDVEQKSFEPRTVRVGTKQNGKAQVLEGIQSGELVVGEGSYILKSELMRSSLVGG